MGTKKGQKRKTARRAYVKKKPTTKEKPQNVKDLKNPLCLTVKDLH